MAPFVKINFYFFFYPHNLVQKSIYYHNLWPKFVSLNFSCSFSAYNMTCENNTDFVCVERHINFPWWWQKEFIHAPAQIFALGKKSMVIVSSSYWKLRTFLKNETKYYYFIYYYYFPLGINPSIVCVYPSNKVYLSVYTFIHPFCKIKLD